MSRLGGGLASALSVLTSGLAVAGYATGSVSAGVAIAFLAICALGMTAVFALTLAVGVES